MAYLAGILDGDGYMKLTPSYRTSGTSHPYYAAVVGLQQLCPSEAVKLFAAAFGGRIRADSTTGGRAIWRCEIMGETAAAALRRLLPFLILKRRQAILLLEVVRQRPHRRGRANPKDPFHEKVKTIRRGLLSLHDGTWQDSDEDRLVSPLWDGYAELCPKVLGWSQQQLAAYLAGIMDSDGNFRVEKRRVRDMVGPHYRISLRCAQVLPSPAVDLLGKVFGGRPVLKRSKRPGHRDLVSWSLHDRKAVAAIRALLPHLRVKWAEACLLLELRRLKARGKEGLTVWVHRTRWQRPITMRKRYYTPDQVAQFERIRQAVASLHSPDLKGGNR